MLNKKNSLQPYKAQWDEQVISHLLRRTLNGPTLAQIKDAERKSLVVVIDQLLEVPVLNEPLSYLAEETIVEFGKTWVNSFYPKDERLKGYHENARRDSLTAWLVKNLNFPSGTIHEKMCLFWHNHFAVPACEDSRATFNYHRKIQNRALGNFKELVKEITVDPCMLIFLNGSNNSSVHPNENYSRELLELFTVGKGNQIGPGDYSNYTEKDVREGARILTGWKVHGILSDTELPYSKFDESIHDKGEKKFSAHFKNAKITDGGDKEYSQYIDLIFEQEETAKYLCRKLYRWFVNHEIDDTIENKIINGLSETLMKNDYEIKPVLKQLLMSRHFFDEKFRGAIIKNPLEFIFSFLNSTKSFFDEDVNVTYNIYMNCNNLLSTLGMNYMVPPSVSGWPAYYQEPSFYKLWVNASSIKSRFDFSELFVLKGGIEVDNRHLEIKTLDFLNSLSKPEDPNQVIDDLILIFLPSPINDSKRQILKSILLNDLPDFEWTTQYNDYSSKKDNAELAEPIKKQFALTLNRLFKFPEFQTF